MVLLVALINALWSQDESSNKPTLVLAPASLIAQWTVEISEKWKGFDLWMCYGDSEDHPLSYTERMISSADLKALPQLDHLSDELRRVLDPQDRS